MRDRGALRYVTPQRHRLGHVLPAWKPTPMALEAIGAFRVAYVDREPSGSRE